MMKMTRTFALLCAIAPLVSFGADATNSPAKPAIDVDTLFTNSVVAKGKGVSITRNQLDTEVIHIKAMYAAQGRQIGPMDSAALDEQVLESLIGKQLVLAKATTEDRAKGKQEFDKAIEKIKANAKLTPEQYDQRLNQQLSILNITKEEWEKQSAEQATIPIVLQRELNVVISDADLKKFYDENPAKFEMPELVRAAHILLMTIDPNTGSELSDDKKAAKKKQIDEILKRARGGEDFGKLAKEFSEDPGSKDNGGEYTFPRGQMDKEFENTAFALKTNQISDVINTKFGYHIIKMYAKSASHRAELDDEVAVMPMAQGGYVIIKKYWIGQPEVVSGTEKLSAVIRQTLLNEQMGKQADTYITKLRKEADVEILDPKLKASIEAREKIMESMKESESANTNSTKAPTPPK
jgi:parvulin-like peptidyl-prolyl isomerase